MDHGRAVDCEFLDLIELPKLMRSLIRFGDVIEHHSYVVAHCLLLSMAPLFVAERWRQTVSLNAIAATCVSEVY
jgi:hypothetical protein